MSNTVGDMLQTMHKSLCVEGNNPHDVSAAAILFFAASVVGAMRSCTTLNDDDTPVLAKHLASCAEEWVTQTHAERLSNN